MNFSSVFKAAVLFAAAAVFYVSPAFAGDKDVVLVLDTSMSMVGEAGGKDIMPQVRDSLTRFVDRLETGDTFTFATFDTATRFWPMVEIKHESNKNILKEYIASGIEVKGKWTFTRDMLEKVIAKGKEINSKNPKRKLLIVILTDAMDDPPPAAKRKHIKLKDYAGNDDKENWYMFFVNLGDKNNPLIAKLSNEVAADVTKKTMVIQGQDDPSKAVNQDVESTLDKENAEKRKSALLKALYVLIPIFALLLAALAWFLYRRSLLKVKGTLEYKPAYHLKGESKSIDLTPFGLAKVTIGRNSLDQYRLTEFEERKPLTLKAERFQSAIKVVIDEELGSQAEFLNEKKESFLRDGDIFKAGGFLFTYNESPEKGK
jgi:hypothetical protein